MRRTLAASVIALMMSGGGISAAGQLGGVVDATKQAGKATKEAAKTAGETTKDAATETAKATKKGATKTKNAVTGEAHATCKDGTRQAAKTQKAADAGCTHHGGVARH